LLVVSAALGALANDEELAAVLAHEIGHWQLRHGLQGVLRSSAALLLVSTVSGDLSALTTFAGTIPFVLLQRGYSREFEEAADAYAVDLLRQADISVAHFATILKKLENARPGSGQDLTYLSTHPATHDRIKRVNPARLPPPPITRKNPRVAPPTRSFRFRLNPASMERERNTVPAGGHTLFIELKENNWTFVLSSWAAQTTYDANNKAALWGSYNYTADKDVARAPMKLMKTTVNVEQLTWGFVNVTATGGELAIWWGKEMATVPFTLTP